MIKKIFQLFWQISDSFNVRMKMMGIVLFGILLLGTAATIQTNHLIKETMSEKIENNGIAIARDVAARSTDYIFTNNQFALLSLIQDTLVNNPDVRYILILDPGGQLIVHSFSDGIPKGLLELNQVASNQRYNAIKIDTEEGIIQDIGVQIFEGRAGIVRIGMSYAGINKMIMDLNKRLLLIIFVVSILGIIFSLIFTSVLTLPLKRLVEATKSVAAGNYNTKVQVWWSKDEFNHLAVAFNDMTKELCRSSRELEAFSQEIVQRNQELSAYNAVLSVASNSFEIKDIIRKSLTELLFILKFSYGRIIILDEQKRECRIGVRITEQTEEPISREDTQELELILPHIKEEESLISDDKARNVIHIPLISSKGIIGILSLGNLHSQLGKRKQKLLMSLANQLGLGVENALLWHKVKEKEEIKARLLQKIIGVQEEERKRIARELHDETGQSLTSLLLGLKMIEKAQDMEQVRERTGELRQVVIDTLTDINKLALELRPTILDDLGLVAAVERYISNVLAKSDLEIELQVMGIEEIQLSSQVEITIYRIIQESLTNIIKHAKASRVNILLEHQGDKIFLVVGDNGIGFNQETIRKKSLEYKHLGLFGMEERAAIIGGFLVIESSPGQGTKIRFEVKTNQL